MTDTSGMNISDRPIFDPLNLDHIGIAVKSIDETEKKYIALWGNSCFHRETVLEQNVKVGFIQAGEIKLVLIEPLCEESSVHRFIEKRGEGMHHLAYRVEDIEKELHRLDELGLRLIDKVPRKGAMNKWVAFLHPKAIDGVLIEICQKMKLDL